MHMIWSPDSICTEATMDQLSNKSTELIIKESMVIQQFINHDGVIIKVYVADDWFNIEARPSIANSGSLLHSQSK